MCHKSSGHHAGRLPHPHSLSSWWPQPAIWHLCPDGKGLFGSGRQMGWTNWERRAQRSPFFFSRIRTGGREARGQPGAWGSMMDRRWPLSYTRVQPLWAEGLWLGRPRREQEWPSEASSTGRGCSARPGTLLPCPGPRTSLPPSPVSEDSPGSSWAYPPPLSWFWPEVHATPTPSPAAPQRVLSLTKVMVTGVEH